MSNNIITTDLQSQYINSGLVTLFELVLDATSEPNTILYFHSGVETDGVTNIEFDGNTYIALPIQATGFEASAEGASNRPTLEIANVTPVLRELLNNQNFRFEDLVGKRLRIRRTFEKYLATAAYEFPVKTYIIDRLTNENPITISMELAAPFDVSGVKIPGRTVIGKYCSWVYQANDTKISGCTWPADSTVRVTDTGVTTSYLLFFTKDDNPIVSLTDFDAGKVSFTGSHSIDDYVEYNSARWRSEVNSNTSIPGTDSNWKEVYTYTGYNQSTSYLYDDVNPLRSPYVLYNGIIWRCTLNSTGQIPEIQSPYWQRADVCGKTLDSCKCRFQFVPSSAGLPRVEKATNLVLPFGGFPGSDKFN